MLKNQIIDPSCYQTDPSKKIVLPPPLAASTLFKLSSFCLGYCTSVLICFDEYLLYTIMSHFTLNTVLDTTSIHSQIFQELKQSVKYVWSGLFILSKLNTIFKTNDLSTIIYNTYVNSIKKKLYTDSFICCLFLICHFLLSAVITCFLLMHF